MAVGLFFNLAVAGMAPLLASLVPKFIYRQGLSVKANHIVLGISAGLLFAIATLDLVPEAFVMTSTPSFSPPASASHGSSEMSSRNVENMPHQLLQQIQPPSGARRLASTTKDGDGPPLAALGVRRLEMQGAVDGQDRPKALRQEGSDHEAHAHSQGQDHDHDDEVDGHNHSEEGHPNRIAMIGVGVGYLVLLIVEQILTASGHSHSHGAPLQINDLDVRHELEETHSAHSHGHRHGGDGGGTLSESFSMVALVALALHCLVDGFVMAGAYEASAQIGARVAVALIIHKIPDGFVLSAVLSASRSNSSFFSTVALLAAMTPLGGLLGYVLMGGISPQVLGFVLGFGAGTFLFITATGIIPEIMSKETPKEIRNLSLLSMVASYVGFFLVDTFFHAH